MGIAVFAASGMFTPLQALMDRFAALRRSLSMGSGIRPAWPFSRNKSKLIANYQENTWTEGRFDSGSFSGSTARPLRVVRMVERGHRPGAAGRMVISGRMADVCAELERMEQLASQGAPR